MDRNGYKKLNPEVCLKTGILGRFRCKVRNIFVNLQIAMSRISYADAQEEGIPECRDALFLWGAAGAAGIRIG